MHPAGGVLPRFTGLYKLAGINLSGFQLTSTLDLILFIENYESLSSQGFGVAAKSTQECRRMDPMSIVVFHQADVGEFIRNEDTLT